MGGKTSNLRSHERTVCIIGAGISGLRAAILLTKVGFNVTILEARDRVGGRIHQDHRFGQPIDLGASWIHGTQGNPIVELARNTGSTTVACSAVESICDTKGVWFDRKKARQYYEEVWEILELAMKQSHANAAAIPDTIKMMDFVHEEIQRKCSHRRCQEPDAPLLAYIAEMWGAFMGDDGERQSLKNLWLDAGLEGDNLFLASTYKDIVHDMYLQISKKVNLQLNCEVTAISNLQSGSLQISSRSGFQGQFEDIVVTAPLGWLKRNENVFSPPLTPEISTAIQSIGYGNLEKIFIKFPKPFWDDPDLRNNAGSARGPAFPIESLFLRPEYATDTNPSRWRTEIVSFSGMPAEFSQPIIMFFVYGQWGRHICRLVRGMLQDSAERYRILDDIFHPYYSKLPNYDPTRSECAPVTFMSTDWQNDEFAGFGSFANMPVGSGDGDLHFKVLREGMGRNRGIWFAGEHTSPPGGLGTVTGAYWSGEEAAKRVALHHGITLDI